MELLDALQDVVSAEPEAEAQPDPARADDAIETQLTQEISTLWTDHVQLSANHKATAKELRLLRARLAEKLYQMKSLLSRPGRGGQWRSWLRDRGINRSTADRLVARHAETLCNHEEDAPSGAISEPAVMTAEKLARVVWSRFGKLLTTDESVIEFICCFAEVSGVGHEQRAEGLVIFKPVPKPAEGVAGSAVASGAVSKAPDEAPAATEEPALEAAAAPLAAVPAAAVADAGSGGVQQP